MSRLIVSMWTTVDGFVAGPDDSMDWLRADADLMDYETGLVENAGALLLGRITHGDFASYWPAVAAGEIDADEGTRRYARRLDQLDKFVASHSGDVALWPGTHHVQDATATAIQRIKDQTAGDVIVYGSLSLIAALNALSLIDEFHLIVHPTLLCRGRPLLDVDQRPTQLELIECRPFLSGAVLLRYGTIWAN
ncbi:Dihydrofolate reductase [Tessaracoccus bendigoensis DSM 12906]|uniref:Dihydrofolate reductase n=1 Tax=Tessaracoccus bendigoensis DSM 12906 TaxID=1123357 RepID=A0A1M6P1T0_9ACTN|nr:dihydrofolate reductase family protein [Tessaracoccus bendigoensis]SHK01868.1 Dihydrofolate reductase [Tessaracoccus bendigoensis DSM 12906]